MNPVGQDDQTTLLLRINFITNSLLSDQVNGIVKLIDLVQFDDVGVIKANRNLDLIEQHRRIFDSCLRDFLDGPPRSIRTLDSSLIHSPKCTLAQLLNECSRTLAITS